MSISLTVFQGRAGDRNGLGVPGAASLGAALAEKLSATAAVIGKPEAVSYEGWEAELAAAEPALSLLAKHFDTILSEGKKPVSTLPRCATALATIPVIARHHPEACVIWFDAHADLNTPACTTTGYLGGMVLAAAGDLWNSGLGGGFRLDRLILAGVRDIDGPEQDIIARHGVTALPPSETATQALRSAIGGRPVYMHIDCDVLDPGIVPTEYECPDGLSLDQLQHACRIIAENQVLGLEIAEFQNIRKAGDRPASAEPLLNALSPILERLAAAAG